MKFSTRKERRANRLERSWWKKLFIGLFSPIFTIGIWYGTSLATYYYFPSLNVYFIGDSRPLYLILSGLLYSGFILALFISLWIWWKLLFNEKIRWWRWQPILLSLFLTCPVFYYTYQKAERVANIEPKFIAHRSISNHNAVENTLEALHLTSQEKPDYIEIDIYETADLDFVVFHDENLSHLAGNYKRPHELSLAELTATTVTDPEYGHTGKIPSLDQFLDEADKLNQKLLLDIKVSPLDSPEMVTQFLNKYQSRLEKMKHQVQSSDLTTMQKILQHSPKFDTFLITNTIMEHDVPGLTGYSMPIIHLTDDVYHQLKERGLAIYTWIANENEMVNAPKHLEIDAIITSYLKKTTDEVQALKKHRDYHALYFKQLDGLKIFPMI